MAFDKTQNMSKTLKGAMLRRRADLRNIPCLVVLVGSDAGKRFELPKGTKLIGRANTDIIINDPELSRAHFSIEYDGTNVFLEDMNSTNGTFVDGQRISEKKDVTSCNFQAGRTLFKIAFKSRSELSFENKLIRDATLDGLTGIMNKSYFSEITPTILTRAAETTSQVAIILADLDKFKQVNDTYGHLAGDLVLKKFSQLVINNMRKDDIFARFGGEEFVILLNGTKVTEKIAMQFAERIRKNVESYCFMYEKKRIPVTVSLGIHFLGVPDSDNLDFDNIIKCADQALYSAKNTGRNKSVLFKHEETDS